MNAGAFPHRTQAGEMRRLSPAFHRVTCNPLNLLTGLSTSRVARPRCSSLFERARRRGGGRLLADRERAPPLSRASIDDFAGAGYRHGLAKWVAAGTVDAFLITVKSPPSGFR